LVNFNITDRAFRIYHNKMVSDSNKFAIGGVLVVAPLVYMKKKKFKGAPGLGLAAGMISYFVSKKLFDL